MIKKYILIKFKNTGLQMRSDRAVIIARDKPTLTLTTCYPFNYIGDAPERYIIEASLVAIN